jgi:hypothetical protein
MQRYIRLLEEIREASDEPAKAYLVRSRLRRALIGLHRGFYDRQDAATLPGGVAERVERLEQVALRLCQPSEALDLRWKRDWAEMRRELEDLEALLHQPTQRAA